MSRKRHENNQKVAKSINPFYCEICDYITFRKNNFTYNKKTRKKISALVVTHVWGNAVDINKLVKECKLKNIKIIEDASESFGSRYNNGQHTGTKGLLGVISFNSNKIITTGGGGALITDDEVLMRV